MADSPAEPQPRPRRWKRWAVLASALMIGCFAWMTSWESETVRRAQGLRLGMTSADVEGIMGKPTLEFFATRTKLVTDRNPGRPAFEPVRPYLVSLPVRVWSYANRSEKLAYDIRSWLRGHGFGSLIKSQAFPVEVIIDVEGRVVRFGRGGVDVKQPAAVSPTGPD